MIVDEKQSRLMETAWHFFVGSPADGECAVEGAICEGAHGGAVRSSPTQAIEGVEHAYKGR